MPGETAGLILPGVWVLEGLGPWMVTEGPQGVPSAPVYLVGCRRCMWASDPCLGSLVEQDGVTKPPEPHPDPIAPMYHTGAKSGSLAPCCIPGCWPGWMGAGAHPRLG